MSDELDTVLVELGDEDRPVHSINVAQLSDLARAELADFRAVWDQLTTERRRQLIATMVEQAETNIHMNFHAILRACLTDADGAVRRLAIEGLWEDERANLVPPLTIILAHDSDPSVRAAAAVSLGRFVLLGELDEVSEGTAREAEVALREAWFRQGEVTEVRRRALEGLAYTSGPGLPELIENAYYDDDPGMRESALFSMGRTNHPRWARMVLEELSSYEPAMRFEAAQAAGEMGLKSAVPALIRRTQDTDLSVRDAAIAALGKIGGPAAKRALEGLIGSSDEALTQAAQDALDEWNFNSESLDNLLLDVQRREVQNRAALDDLDGDIFAGDGFDIDGSHDGDGEEDLEELDADYLDTDFDGLDEFDSDNSLSDDELFDDELSGGFDDLDNDELSDDELSDDEDE